MAGETLYAVSAASSRRDPRGRYVYAWFNNDSPFPFYVGKGVGGRGWQRHMHKGQSAFCNKLRSSSSGFRVHVVRDNMTNEGAMLLESSLIDLFSALGGCAGNQVSPLRRQEVPPLWLHEVVRQFADEMKARTTANEQQQSDGLFEKIVSVLDDTEGRGMLCLTPQKIADRCGVSRDSVVSCMKKHGLNP
jgi:hypothetical protein